MPFLEQGASDEPMRSLGRVTTMRVDPTMILQLKAKLQPIHDDVEKFLAACNSDKQEAIPTTTSKTGHPS